MNKQISFEEIRTGDLIQVVSVYEQKGIKYYRSSVGTAHVISGGATWYTEEHGHLASYGKGSTIELLDRPKPPLPTTPGTVFRATEIRGEKCDVVVLVREASNYLVSSPDPVYSSSHLIKGESTHRAAQITAWEPIEVTNA